MGHRCESSQAHLGWSSSPPGRLAKCGACPARARPSATAAQHGLAPESKTRARIPDARPRVQGLAMGDGSRSIAQFRLACGCWPEQQRGMARL
eukprot:7507011-Pyramimonas_sp.AAC.1